jgi:hypothetical protein
MSILQDFILEAICSQKHHVNVSLILNSHGGMGIWNVAFMSRCGRVHRQASTPVVSTSASKQCSQVCHYIIKLWTCHLHFSVKNTHFVYRFCNGNMNTITDTTSMMGHPQISLGTSQYLNELCPDWWISHGNLQNWPLQLPDLTPLDFCV